jgi:hypothetical protein
MNLVYLFLWFFVYAAPTTRNRPPTTTQPRQPFRVNQRLAPNNKLYQSEQSFITNLNRANYGKTGRQWNLSPFLYNYQPLPTRRPDFMGSNQQIVGSAPKQVSVISKAEVDVYELQEIYNFSNDVEYLTIQRSGVLDVNFDTTDTDFLVLLIDSEFETIYEDEGCSCIPAVNDCYLNCRVTQGVCRRYW